MLALIAVASAEPLVYDGDPAIAAAVAAARGGVDPATLTPSPLSALRDHPPVLVAGGAVAGCAPDPADLTESIDRAEGALLYGDFDEASRRLDAARNAACAAVDPPRLVLARIEVLAGLTAEERGDQAAARDRYRAALGYDHDVPWPDAYPASRKALFDAITAAWTPGTTALTVRPGVPAATVDGAVLAGEAPLGEHLVRVGAVAARVTLDEAPNTLVVPAAYPADALAWAADDARRADVSALLAATLGEGTALWLVHGDTAWHGVAGRTDWTVFAPPPSVPAPPAVPLDAHPRHGWRTAALTVTVAGLATTAASLATVGVTALRANDAADRATWAGDPLRDTYDHNVELHGSAWKLAAVGLGVAGAGGIGVAVAW